MDELISVSDYENHAKSILPDAAFKFYKSVAVGGRTRKRELEQSEKLLIIPHVLRDVSLLHTETAILGGTIRLPFPIGIVATAYHGLAHTNAEIETAKGSFYCGLLTSLTKTILSDWNLTRKMVQQAKEYGYKAVAVTIDIPVLGKRNYYLESGYQPIISTTDHLAGNFPTGDVLHYAGRPDIGWEDLEYLVQLSDLPVIVKGIMSAGDAIKAADCGVAAIQVSTHGGRQLDSTLSAVKLGDEGGTKLEILPHIISAVGDRCDVYIDGGFRTGSDIFKALALGAKMVFLGRPILWGLAVNGRWGIEKVITLLHCELERTMQLAGFGSQN